jgi:hypothetical protein
MAEPEEEDDITPEQEKYESEHHDRPSDNPSVARCIRAWNRAYQAKLKDLDEDDSDYEAEQAGKKHYLRAMPPLAGYQNVSDFIACVTYVELIEVIRHTEAQHCFDAAKVALGALRREPKSADSALRGPGRPRKEAEIAGN